MTRVLSGDDLARVVSSLVRDAVTAVGQQEVWVKASSLLEVAHALRNDPGLDFALLNSVTAVDYIDHFEVIYHITSINHNRAGIMKVRCGEGRLDPVVPSVVEVWQGADYQEREAWDLMGVKFEGHPNHKRIMLWDEFPGHPSRKDFLR